MHSLGSPGPEGLGALGMKAAAQQEQPMAPSQRGQSLDLLHGSAGVCQAGSQDPPLCHLRLCAHPTHGGTHSPGATMAGVPTQPGAAAQSTSSALVSLLHTKNPPAPNQGVQNASIPHPARCCSKPKLPKFPMDPPGKVPQTLLCSVHPPCQDRAPSSQRGFSWLLHPCSNTGKKFHKDIQILVLPPAVNSSHTPPQ